MLILPYPKGGESLKLKKYLDDVICNNPWRKQ